MAHKKIERKKELDRRRKRRAERIKARIHEAQAAAKNLSCAGAPARSSGCAPALPLFLLLSEFREIISFSGCFCQ